MMSKKMLYSLSLAFAFVFVGGIVCGTLISPAFGKGHEAAHGGVLNVIGEEVGHAEIRLTGDLVEVWFVGGGNDTDRAVPVKAHDIRLTVEKELLLEAAPLVLAGESEDNCSHFTTNCEWLGAMDEFEAHGHVLFKGQEMELIIHYPEGYDPHHGDAAGHEHHHEH